MKDGLTLLQKLMNYKPSKMIKRKCLRCGREGYKSTMERRRNPIARKYFYVCRFGCRK